MLNATFEFKWNVRSDGSVECNMDDEFRQFTSLDGLSKHADTYELDEII